MIDEDRPRWDYRFENFRRALARLEVAIERLRKGQLDELGHEGLVQRFEYTFELGWKTLADYLSGQGLTLPIGGVRGIIRAAFEVGVVDDGDAWMAALKARNECAHVYDEDRINAMIGAIEAQHLYTLVALRKRLSPEART